MFYNFKNAENALKGIKISKQNKQLLLAKVEEYIKVYKKLQKDPKNYSIVFCDIKEKGFISFTVFDKRYVPVEQIEDASEIISKVIKEKDKKVLVSAYIVNFSSDYMSFEVSEFKSSDFKTLELKKAKTVVYGVTDSIDILPVTINLIDVKGCEYDMLCNAIKHYFSKSLDRVVDKISCCVVDFIL